MSEREWRFYLDDMLSFAENVVTYCEGLDLETFEQTGLNYDATVRNLELIGEAANNIYLNRYKNRMPHCESLGFRRPASASTKHKSLSVKATTNGSTAIRDKILASLARYRARRISKFPCAFWRLSIPRRNVSI